MTHAPFAFASVIDRVRSRAAAADSVQGSTEAFAAVAMIFGHGARGARLLFIQRAEFPGDPWSGDVAFPGGKREPRDASLHDTAVREAREEVGVHLLPEASLGRFPDVQAHSSGARVARFAFALPPGDVVLVPSAEVREVFWVDLVSLAAPDRVGSLTRERRGQRFEFPYIDVDNHRVWGLTLRMVEDALRALRDG